MIAAVACSACGGQPAPAAGTGPTQADAPAPLARPAASPADTADGDDEDGGGGADEDGLEVSSSRGSVDPAVVNARLQPRAGAIEACYATRVGRRKWLGGGLELAWDVGADGAIGGVRIATSDLGAWPIEKCVLAVARAVSFGKPRGNKPARVTAPLSFSAGTGAILWDQGRAEQAVGDRLAKLASCTAPRQPAPTDVTITMYLGTRGKVQTVGFASPRGFAEAWADCAERAILGWSLTDPRGKVAKLSITFNPSGSAGDLDDERDL